jgi:hypothetical protein
MHLNTCYAEHAALMSKYFLFLAGLFRLRRLQSRSQAHAGMLSQPVLNIWATHPVPTSA